MQGSSGVLAIGDRILAVDGRHLKRRKLCDLISPQPTHLFKVQRLGADAVSNRVSLPATLRQEIEEAKGTKRRGFGLFGRGGRGGAGGLAEPSSEKSRSTGRSGGKKGRKDNPFVMNDAQFDDWFQ